MTLEAAQLCPVLGLQLVDQNLRSLFLLPQRLAEGGQLLFQTGGPCLRLWLQILFLWFPFPVLLDFLFRPLIQKLQQRHQFLRPF